MHRREFLTKSAAAFAVANLPSYGGQLGDVRKRVGLIGTGWYGKSDLLRMVQVAPVDVVSLCDVDSTMLANAAAATSINLYRTSIFRAHRTCPGWSAHAASFPCAQP